MICAIHQPNFFPWLGYFRKITRADVFVFLDAVQFIKTGGSWTNRVRLLVNGEPRWITAPIIRTHGVQAVNQVQFDESQPWRKKLVRCMEQSYGKAPCFREVWPWVEPLVLNPTTLLAEYNITGILALAERLDLHPQFIRHSALNGKPVYELQGSARLVEICQEVGADTYLAGDGADGYEDLSVYESHAIRFERTCFRAEPYTQTACATFTPGLSVLDALFNTGLAETRRIVKGELR